MFLFTKEYILQTVVRDDSIYAVNITYEVRSWREGHKDVGKSVKNYCWQLSSSYTIVIIPGDSSDTYDTFELNSCFAVELKFYYNALCILAAIK